MNQYDWNSQAIDEPGLKISVNVSWWKYGLHQNVFVFKWHEFYRIYEIWLFVNIKFKIECKSTFLQASIYLTILF